jgi:hypothetical protein
MTTTVLDEFTTRIDCLPDGETYQSVWTQSPDARPWQVHYSRELLEDYPFHAPTLTGWSYWTQDMLDDRIPGDDGTWIRQELERCVTFHGDPSSPEPQGVIKVPRLSPDQSEAFRRKFNDLHRGPRSRDDVKMVAAPITTDPSA